MNIEEYSAQIKAWSAEYGVPSQAFRYKPNEVSLVCKKCRQIKQKMSRHHIANDFMFAKLRPDLYAARYLEFRKEDCDKLCERCHKSWHKKIKPLVKRILVLARAKQSIVSEEWCEKYRSEILMLYDGWIKQKRRKVNAKTKRKRNRRKAKRIRRSSTAV